MTLAEHNQSIRSREDFVAFLRALTADLHDKPETWENGSLERFLEALAVCAEDRKSEPAPQQANWKALADMLMAAKVYEQMDEVACA